MRRVSLCIKDISDKMKTIDLRSDTITKPTPAMREVMASAEVGDDVFGDDPTVIKLESYIAELLGKEAALFVPSGTMANQLAVRCQTSPGDEILIDTNAHIYWYEAGGPAALSGVTCKHLPGVRGIFTSDDVLAALRPDDNHFPPTTLLSVENTHNRGGGSVWSIDSIRKVTKTAREAGLQTHLDGARLWNASVSSGLPESEYAECFDSVSVCFSKGLGAPVGSALLGSEQFIRKARRFRKQFGGGMRQAGIIAAAALYATVNHRERLAEDHNNAYILANGISSIPGIEIDVNEVDTNMVYFAVSGMSAPQLAENLKGKGLLVLAIDQKRIRAVTSLMVDQDDIQLAIGMIGDTISRDGS